MKRTTERIKPYPMLKSQNVRMLPMKLKEFDFITCTTNVCTPDAGLDNTPPTVCKAQKMRREDGGDAKKECWFQGNSPNSWIANDK